MVSENSCSAELICMCRKTPAEKYTAVEGKAAYRVWYGVQNLVVISLLRCNRVVLM